MFSFTALFYLILSISPDVVWSWPVPGADGPSFYLVAVSLATSSVRPVLLEPEGGFARLQGNGFPVQHYFFQGKLRATLDRTGQPDYRPYLDTGFEDTVNCATYGQLGYLPGPGYTSANTCASYDTFHLQSNSGSSQLGAKLTFNFDGGFYSCGSDEDIYYKRNEGDNPLNCYPVELWTVPVA